uniref:Uncharacterized protein n=1 Tax=Romanomermis culicivorax TaxID=13658 RepID=A0A915IGB9_ROMCU
MEDKLVRISSEMARRTDVDGTLAENVKGPRVMERRRLGTPPRIVHQIEERLEEIRWKSKPAWKSNLVDMNMDNY